MKTLTSFTPEQEAKIPLYVDKWKRSITDRADSQPSAFECARANRALYEVCKFDAPVVVQTESPAAVQLAVNLLYHLCKYHGNGNTVEQNRVAYLDYAENYLAERLGAKIAEGIVNGLDFDVEAAVGQLTEGEESEPEEVKFNFSYYEFGYYGSLWSSSWLGWSDFLDSEFDVLSDKLRADRKILEDASLATFMSVQLEGLVVGSKFPVTFLEDGSGELHSVEGPAISYGDGYCTHYFHGDFVPSQTFAKVSAGDYATSDFAAETNEEYKSVALRLGTEIHGDNFVVSLFGDDFDEIDTYVDRKAPEFLEGTTGGMNVGVYKLLKGVVEDTPVAYVRCYCPSTDRMFHLGVDTRHHSAKDAIASLYRIPAKLKPHIKNISRQGERFSTTFTPEGLEIARSLKGDINYESLSGDEYFSLMRYEF